MPPARCCKGPTPSGCGRNDGLDRAARSDRLPSLAAGRTAVASSPAAQPAGIAHAPSIDSCQPPLMVDSHRTLGATAHRSAARRRVHGYASSRHRHVPRRSGPGLAPRHAEGSTAQGGRCNNNCCPPETEGRTAPARAAHRASRPAGRRARPDDRVVAADEDARPGTVAGTHRQPRDQPFPRHAAARATPGECRNEPAGVAVGRGAAVATERAPAEAQGRARRATAETERGSTPAGSFSRCWGACGSDPSTRHGCDERLAAQARESSDFGLLPAHCRVGRHIDRRDDRRLPARQSRTARPTPRRQCPEGQGGDRSGAVAAGRAR
jgi:hypothetical protein